MLTKNICTHYANCLLEVGFCHQNMYTIDKVNVIEIDFFLNLLNVIQYNI